MTKEFISGRLQLTSVDPETEKKVAVRLNNLTEDADSGSVAAVRSALQGILLDPIELVEAVHTYVFA